MPRKMSIGISAVVVVMAVAACGSPAVPTTSPDAVSTIVAATMSAITPPVPPTNAPPTSAPPTTASGASSLPPTSQVVVPTASLPNATRISFLTDATTGVISAPIGPGQRQAYVLQALQGQVMMLNVDSLNQDVTLSLKTQGGTSMLNPAAHQSTWQGALPQTEDYYITVYGGTATENFTLTVTIPFRIKFAEGSISAKLSGKTAGGYAVAYTAFAIKDQEMTVTLSNLSADAALTIYGFTDGQPYVRSVMEKEGFSFTLPATQDYIILVVPRAGGTVSYLMTVKIE